MGMVVCSFSGEPDLATDVDFRIARKAYWDRAGIDAPITLEGIARQVTTEPEGINSSPLNMCVGAGQV
jgi:hypothetical protein